MNPDTIVITEEKVHPDAVALLKDYRLVYTGAKFTQEELVALVEREQPVAILSRYGKINEQVQAASRKLRVIGRHGVGMDAIDQEAAKRLGIMALPATGSNSQAVAELTLGLILACARRITWLDKRMHEGHWDKQSYLGFELSGATLGVVGCGSIGSRVVRFAQAIGMKVIVCDPYLDADQLPAGTTRVELEELLVQSDVVFPALPPRRFDQGHARCSPPGIDAQGRHPRQYRAGGHVRREGHARAPSVRRTALGAGLLCR